MDNAEIEQQKKIEFIIWLAGMAGILLVIISQSKTAAAGFLSVKLYAPILLVSMLFLCTSLFMKIKRERKKKKFSIFNHTRELIRVVVGLGIAIYYLIGGHGFQ